jgi:aryl-alcohol dehydrogenase-like predicted oxidoreductase
MEMEMDYTTLGRSGLRVSRLSLGAMTFGAGTGIWGEIAGLDREQATRLVAAALEQGVNLIDTADAYSQGQSEQVVGQVMADLGLDETRMLVGTKVRLRTGPGQNEVGLGRSHIMRSVEASLERIGRDHIDLLQLHDRDALVPLDETLRVLDDLVTQGKVRHIGVCNFSAGDLERAHGITARTDRTRIASNQVYYSLAARDIEHEIAPVARANDVALLVWSPLSGGYLSGKYTPGGGHADAGRRANLNFPPINPAKVDPIVLELREVAQALESTPAQVALAWVLGRSEVASVTIGARSQAQLADNLQAAQLVLPPDQRERLDRISQPEKPFPYWMQQFHDKDRVPA